MSGCSCSHSNTSGATSARYRRILWAALAINLGMFLVEIGAGLHAGSVSLLSDSLDFFGDAANYGVSLWVLGLGVAMRARASLAKAVTMGSFGVFILSMAVANFVEGSVPDAPTMGVVGVIALLANLLVAALLYAYREGDSNMRSVWLCSRNDALGNLAVMLAALGVFGTGSGWPDLIVASLMALLSISAAVQIIRHARQELRTQPSRLARAERHDPLPAGCLEPSRRLEREQRETTEDADQGDQPADTVRTVLLCLPDRVQRFLLSHHHLLCHARATSRGRQACPVAPAGGSPYSARLSAQRAFARAVRHIRLVFVGVFR